MKHIKYIIPKYYIPLLASEVSIVNSNCSNITGSETAKVLRELQQLQKELTIQKTSSKNACEEVCFSTNFHKIQGFADITNKQRLQIQQQIHEFPFILKMPEAAENVLQNSCHASVVEILEIY